MTVTQAQTESQTAALTSEQVARIRQATIGLAEILRELLDDAQGSESA